MTNVILLIGGLASFILVYLAFQLAPRLIELLQYIFSTETDFKTGNGRPFGRFNDSINELAEYKHHKAYEETFGMPWGNHYDEDDWDDDDDGA